MSEKDVASIDYFEDNERFADLYNVYYFAGAQIIKPEDVHERNRSNALINREKNHTQKKKNNKSIVVSRDITRELGTWTTSVVIATEMQSGVHYAMPVRVMTGDGANYHSQWRKIEREHKKQKDVEGDEFISGFSKEDKLVPITTTVLYFGQEEWDGPRRLKDMMDLDGLPQEIQDMIADYPLHIIEVRKFADYEKFRTDLQWVFGFLQRDQQDEDLEKYVTENRDSFADLPEDAYDMIRQFSNSNILDANKENYKTEKGGVNMCKALDDMIAKGEARGLERGIQGAIKICQELGASLELTVQKLINEFSLSEDKAKDYIHKYWITP